MDDRLAPQARLQKRIGDDLRDRVAAHKANIARLESARLGARNLSAAVENRPLVMLAQGDSWFDYPLHGNGPLPGVPLSPHSFGGSVQCRRRS